MEENENVIQNNNTNNSVVSVNKNDNTNDIDTRIAKYKSELTSSNDTKFPSTMDNIIKDNLINNILSYINNNINTAKSGEYIEFVYYVFAILTNSKSFSNTTHFNDMFVHKGNKDNTCYTHFDAIINTLKDHLDTNEAKTILNTVYKCIYLIIHKLLSPELSIQSTDINSYFKLFFIINSNNGINNSIVSVILHFIYEIVKDNSQKLSLLGLNNEGTLSNVLKVLFTFINSANSQYTTINKEIEFKALIIVQTIIQDNSIIKSAKKLILESQTLFDVINAIISEESLIIMGNILNTLFEYDNQANLVDVVFKYEFLEKDYDNHAYFGGIEFIKHAHIQSHQNKRTDEISFYSKLFNVMYALFMQNAAVHLNKKEINDKLLKNIKRFLRGKSTITKNENEHISDLAKENNVFQVARIATLTMNVIQSNLHLNNDNVYYDLVWYLFITMCDVLLIKANKVYTPIEEREIKNTFQSLTQFIIENAYRNDNFINKVFSGTSRGSLNFYKYFKPLINKYNKYDSFVYNFLNEIDKDKIYKKETYAAKSEICKLIVQEDYAKLELRLSLRETETFVEVNDKAINDICNVFDDGNSNSNSSSNDMKKINVEGVMMVVIALMRNESILNERKYEPLFKLVEYLCYESDDYLDKALKEDEMVFSLLWHINDVLQRNNSSEGTLHKAINNDDNNTLIDFIVFLLNEEQLTSQIFNLICSIMDRLLDGNGALHVSKVNQFIALNGVGMLIYHLNKNGSDDVHFAMLIKKFMEHIKTISDGNNNDSELMYCLNEMTICEMINQITHIEDIINNEHNNSNSNSNSNEQQQQIVRYNKTINANHYCALIELFNQLCLYMFSSSSSNNNNNNSNSNDNNNSKQQSKQLHRMGISIVEQTNIIPFIINELQISYSPEDSLLTNETCTFYILLNLLTLMSNQTELIKYICIKSLFIFIESVYDCINSDKLPLDKITLSLSTIMYNVLKDKDCGKWIYMKSKVQRCIDYIRKDILKKESKITANDMDDFIRLVKVVIDIESSKWEVKERDKIITKQIEQDIKNKYGEAKYNEVDLPEVEQNMFEMNEEEDNDGNDNDNDNIDNDNSGNIVQLDNDNSKEFSNLQNSNVNNSSSMLLFNSTISENPNTLLTMIHEANTYTNELVSNNNDTNINKLNMNLSSIKNTISNRKEHTFDIPYQTFMNELINTLYMLITSSKQYNNVTVLAYAIIESLITSNACNDLIENELIAIDNNNDTVITNQCIITKFTSLIETELNNVDDDTKKIFKSLTTLIAFIIRSTTLYTKYKANFTNTASTLFKCINNTNTLSDAIAQCVCVIAELIHKDKNVTLDEFSNSNITVDNIVNTFVKISINSSNAVTPVSDVIKSDVAFIEKYYQHPKRDEFLKCLIKCNLTAPEIVFTFLNTLLQHCDQIYIAYIKSADNELQQLFTSCINNINNINHTHIQQIITFYNAINSDEHEELSYDKGIYDKVINNFTCQLPINKFNESDLTNTLALINKVHRLAENKAIYNTETKYNTLFKNIFLNEHAVSACSFVINLLSIAIENDMYKLQSNNANTSNNFTNFITKAFTSLVNTHNLTKAENPTLEKLIEIITKCIQQGNRTFQSQFLTVFRNKCTTSYLFNLLCNRFIYIIDKTKDKSLCKESTTICVELTVSHKDIFINDTESTTNMIDLVKSIGVVEYQTKEEFVNAYGSLLNMLAFINKEHIVLELNDDVWELLEYMCDVITVNDDQGKMNLIEVNKFKEWCKFVMGCLSNADDDDVSKMKEKNVERCIEGALGEGDDGVVQWIEMCAVEMERFVDEPTKLEFVVGMVKNKFDNYENYLNEMYNEDQIGEKRFVEVLKVIDEKYKDNDGNKEIILTIKNHVKEMLDTIS